MQKYLIQAIAFFILTIAWNLLIMKEDLLQGLIKSTIATLIYTIIVYLFDKTKKNF